MAPANNRCGSWFAGLILAGMLGPVAIADGLPSLDIDILTDVRLTSVAGEQTWFDGWQGKLRFGGDWSGDRQTKLWLSNVSIVAKSEITWDLHAFVHAKYDPEQDKPLDLAEAFLKYKPAPTSNLRYEFKAGLYFPHISRENTGLAWTSPYTITPSAINSWIGEEVRVLGAEAKATLKMERSSLALTGGVFGFNDPAGTLLAFRGWALGDYVVGAFSQLSLPSLNSIGAGSSFLPKQPEWVNPVREIDNRVGFYGALDWQYAGKVKAGAFYYDNRGDPEVLRHKQYAWDTRFWNFYVEVDGPAGIELVSQYLRGRTEMGFLKYGGTLRSVDVNYASGFVLASRKFDDFRVSVRRDWFDVDDNSFLVEDNNEEVGSAWTAAVSYDFGRKDKIIAEILRVRSERPARVDQWDDPFQAQTLLQLSYRHRF
ncbi:MAG: hypothetical protein HWE25_04620 [Alphaproteobacteria bacterium]|nr:hypothetical protein [Alphaproteobacteria bacterium]